MLRNVLLMSTSGLVLFSKEFAHAVAQPRLIGSLLTAMIEFSSKTTGSPVSYIELSNVSVTIVTNDMMKVFCALFHDRQDGAKFGKILATEILAAFVEEYATDLGALGHNLKDFHGFNFKIIEIIRDCVRPILAQLQCQRGIQKALFVTKDSVVHTTTEVDQLGVLANFQSLINLAADSMTFVDDVVKHIIMDGPNNTTLSLQRIGESTLVVLYKKNTSNAEKCHNMIQDTVQLLHVLQQVSR